MVAARARRGLRQGGHRQGRPVAGPGAGVRRRAHGRAPRGRRDRRHQPLPGWLLHRPRPRRACRALDDNRAAVDEAAALSTDTLVLVSGGLPPGSRDLRGARERVAEALAELAPYAATRGVRLAIEPCTRCTRPTAAWSPPRPGPDLAERFPAEQVGVVVDTYHRGGTTGRPSRSPARARAAVSTPSSWPTGSPAPGGRSAGPGSNWATEAWISGCSAAMWKPPGSTARSRWRSSTRRCGPATGRRSWRKWRSGTYNMPAESPARDRE